MVDLTPPKVPRPALRTTVRQRRPCLPSAQDALLEGGMFDCNICLDVATDPVITVCGHLYWCVPRHPPPRAARAAATQAEQLAD